MNPVSVSAELSQSEARTVLRARAILARHLQQRGDVLASPAIVRDYLRVLLAGEEREVFYVVFLDAQHRVIAADPMFAGTLTQTSVYPREIVKAALSRNAAAVLLSHNHPSGVAEPSFADRALTGRLREALALVDVKVLDHFVVAGDVVLSFSECGLM